LAGKISFAPNEGSLHGCFTHETVNTRSNNSVRKLFWAEMLRSIHRSCTHRLALYGHRALKRRQCTSSKPNNETSPASSAVVVVEEELGPVVVDPNLPIIKQTIIQTANNAAYYCAVASAAASFPLYVSLCLLHLQSPLPVVGPAITSSATWQITDQIPSLPS